MQAQRSSEAMGGVMTVVSNWCWYGSRLRTAADESGIEGMPGHGNHAQYLKNYRAWRSTTQFYSKFNYFSPSRCIRASQQKICE